MSSLQMMAVVRDGMLKPEVALPFPEDSRVRITVEAVEPENARLAAWERLLTLMDEKPIVGLAGKYSREELYERD